MMTEVNPGSSAEVAGLFDNPTQRGDRRRVFWLATVCLFLFVAALIHLGTIPSNWVYPPRWLNFVPLWLILPPLWFLPIIVSDIRGGTRRADRGRSGAFTFIVNTAKVIGIISLLGVISFVCAGVIDESVHPSASMRFQEVANSMTGE